MTMKETFMKRNAYSKWSKRELKRQIDSCLFQRLLLSKGNTNKKKVYELSKEGQTITTPNDILKEPYVFKFLGIKEEKKIHESDFNGTWKRFYVCW